jgi:hypothetical protein
MIYQNPITFFLAFMSATSPSLPKVPWSSIYSNWYDRTSPLPSSTPISKSNLLFTVSYDAMSGSGLSLALFKPGIAVTSAGQIRKIHADDFVGFSKLAEEVSTLPIPDSSRDYRGMRAFRIDHLISCRPITILNVLKVPEAGEPVLDKSSVYGFSKGTQALEGGGNLPGVLWELLGLVSEAPSSRDVEVDEDVLKRIRGIKTEL